MRPYALSQGLLLRRGLRGGSIELFRLSDMSARSAGRELEPYLYKNARDKKKKEPKSAKLFLLQAHSWTSPVTQTSENRTKC